MGAAKDNKPTDTPVPDAGPTHEIDMVPDDWGPKYYGDIADALLTRHGPDEIGFDAGSHFLLVLLTPQPRREVRLGGSRLVTFDAPAGTVEIIPEGASFQARWAVPKENILINLGQKRLEAFAALEMDIGRLEMRPLQPGATDKVAVRIAGLMRDEFVQRTTPPSRLYMEALQTALLLQTVRNHSSLADRPSREAFRGGLSPTVWRTLEEYMRENLAADLSLTDLAARTGLSYSHFMRAFRQSTGFSPHRYIMQLRANRALELASTTHIPLKQVAFQCGFSSQSHMTTVMRTLLNSTPGEIRAISGAITQNDE